MILSHAEVSVINICLLTLSGDMNRVNAGVRNVVYEKTDQVTSDLMMKVNQ